MARIDIEQLKDIIFSSNLPSVYDMEYFNVPEFLYALTEKINQLITNMDYLLDEGMKEEVILKLNEWFQDGTLEQIINSAIFTNIYYVSNYVKDVNIINDVALSQLVNDINLNPNPIKVIFNIPKLKIGKPQYITRGNIEIDYNNCSIEWENYSSVGSNSGIDRNIGVFNFKGTESNTQIAINYTSYLSPVVFDTFTTSDSTINEGDYLILKLGGNTGVAGVNDPITPYIERLVKVVKLMNGKYYIDYRNSWRELINQYGLGQYVKHTNTLENITIKNFKYIDKTILTNVTEDVNIQYSGRSNNNLVCGIYFYCCSNIKLENIKGIKNTFPVVETFKCNGVYLDRLEVDRPQIIGPGEGYGIQLMQTHNFICKNLNGNQERHVIDITEGSNGVVENVNSYNTRAFGISQHGAYEHDIIYRNCNGQIQYGNSGDSFGNACKNITYENCRGRIMGLYCENLYITHSEIEFDAYGTVNTIIEHTKMIIRDWGGTKEVTPRAVRGKTSSIRLINSTPDIDISASPVNWSTFRTIGQPFKIDLNLLNGWIKKPNTKNCLTVDGNNVVINVCITNGTYTNNTKLFTFSDSFRPIFNEDVVISALGKTANGWIPLELYVWKNEVSLYREIANANAITQINATISYILT